MLLVSRPLPREGGNRPTVPTDIQDLEADLLYLRKGAGVTPERVNAAGVLRLVLGGQDLSYADVRERLVSAIRSLHEADAELLMDVFALSPDTGRMRLLRERRAYYGDKVGRKAETVAAREKQAVVNLRNQLLTGWYPASPLGVRVPELHNGIVNESVRITTVVADGYWQETREHYRFLALFDEADYLRISSSFPGRPVPESPFTVRTRRLNDSWNHDFHHAGPMRRGHLYDLRYKLVPDPDYGHPGRLRETSRAFHERTLTAIFETVFLGARPRTVWSFNRLSFLERPGTPTTNNQLDLKGGSTVTTQYHDLYGGLFSGMGWEWR